MEYTLTVTAETVKTILPVAMTEIRKPRPNAIQIFIILPGPRFRYHHQHVIL